MIEINWKLVLSVINFIFKITVVLLPIIIFVYKVKIRNWFNKDLNKFVEDLKHNLKKDEIKFNKLHDLKINAIIELNNSLCELNNFTEKVYHTMPRGNKSKDIEIKLNLLERLDDKRFDFLAVLRKNEMFFISKEEKDIYNLFEVIKKEHSKISLFLRVYENEEINEIKTYIEKYDETWKSLDELIPRLKKKLYKKINKLIN